MYPAHGVNQKNPLFTRLPNEASDSKLDAETAKGESTAIFRRDAPKQVTSSEDWQRISYAQNRLLNRDLPTDYNYVQEDHHSVSRKEPSSSKYPSRASALHSSPTALARPSHTSLLHHSKFKTPVPRRHAPKPSVGRTSNDVLDNGTLHSKSRMSRRGKMFVVLSKIDPCQSKHSFEMILHCKYIFLVNTRLHGKCICRSYYCVKCLCQIRYVLCF